MRRSGRSEAGVPRRRGRCARPGRQVVRVMGALAVVALTPAVARAQGNPAAPGFADSLAITFVANEGFLVTHDSTKILVDALFGSAERPYAVFPSAALVAQMEAARPPFDDVDLVLTTHPHDDHFQARTVAALLARSPGAVFLSTGPAVGAVVGLDSALAARAHVVTPARMHARRTARIGPVEVEAMWVDHGRPDFENLAFALRWNGVSLLHLGDSLLEEYEHQQWSPAGFDVAFVPPTFFRADPAWGVHLLRDVLGARSIVFMHHNPGDAADLEALAERLRPSFPQGRVIVPTAPLQTFVVPAGGAGGAGGE